MKSYQAPKKSQGTYPRVDNGVFALHVAVYPEALRLRKALPTETLGFRGLGV